MRPWCKRFFLFMISQGVLCRKSDMQRWNKAVMTQKQRSEKSQTAFATCSFLISGTKQLPKLQDVTEKTLLTLNTKLKRYGDVIWFIFIEDKAYFICNIFTVKQAAKLLNDIDSGQFQRDVITSFKSDLGRARSSFQYNDSLVVTVCPDDDLVIRNTVAEAAGPKLQPAESDEKVGSHTQDAYAGKIAPFMRNQPVEVFSKTSGQWVIAKVVCVQEDSEGIFATVRRIDGHELDYDIENVREVRVEPTHSNPMPMLAKDIESREQMLHNSNGSLQRGDSETPNKPPQKYSKQELAQEHMDDVLAESQPLPSTYTISEAEWFKRMETFHILDKIRSVKTWLYRMIEEKEQLPRMIAGELQEVSEMFQKRKHGL